MEHDLEEFTHSHTRASPPHMRALYIGESASLTVHDREGTDKTWSRLIIRPEDDRYLRLLKNAFLAFPGNNSPNHLMVGIEALFSQSDTKAGRWHYWHLTGTGEHLRDFCSSPLSEDRYLSIKLEGEDNPQNIVINSGTVLRRITFDSTSYHLDKSFPILSWVDHEFIQSTFYSYPHSEIEALNAIIKINFHSIFDPIIRENNILQGLVIKFYSYNDICGDCQNAIQCFIPKFQGWIKEEFGGEEGVLPVTAIGMVNHCFGFNKYYNKEGEICKIKELNAIIKDAVDGIQFYLKEGVIWESLQQSHYNSRKFALHQPGAYKPFSETIHAPRQKQEPVLYIYIKQPDLEDVKGHLNEDGQKQLGIEVMGPPESKVSLEKNS
jgi:hypothetical protein